MREEYHVATDRFQFRLDVIIHGTTFPIVSVENNIKFQFIPSSQFIHISLGNDFVYIANRFNNSAPIPKWYNGCFVFVNLNIFVCTNSDNQVFASFFCSPQNIKMSNMKHIEYTGCVSDFIFFLIHMIMIF